MSPLLRPFVAISHPPFKGLGLAVVLYFAWAYMVYPHNGLWRGNLPDPDDFMYLTQTLDWLNGQGWYDHIQHRMNPPAGVYIHFSRFVQIPLAAGILFFKQFGLSEHVAALVTAMIEPLVLLSIYLTVLRRTTAQLVPESWAGASAFVALFCFTLMIQFMPGQVGHHGPVVILMTLLLGLFMRLFDEPEKVRIGVVIGFVFAFMLMLALESLPWVLLLSGVLGLWSLRHGGMALRSAAAFAASFLAGSIVCLIATRNGAALFEPDIATYSIVYVWLAAAIGVPFVGGMLLGARTRAQTRWLVGLALAIGSASLFLYRFPALAAGPYGGMDQRLATVLLGAVINATPIIDMEDPWTKLFFLMEMGVITLACALFFLWRAKGVEKEKWGVIILLQMVAMGLAVFYQARFTTMVMALAPLSLTALLQRGWTASGNLEGGRKTLIRLGLVLLIGPLPSVLVPALYGGISLVDILLFPVLASDPSCEMSQLQNILQDSNKLGDKPHLILSPIELGSELLFRTNHSVLAAPYHMNVEGNLDAAKFFTTRDEDEAYSIAQRRHADLVIVCSTVSGYYQNASRFGSPTFIKRMFTSALPEGLESLSSEEAPNYLIFRVRGVDAETPPIQR